METTRQQSTLHDTKNQREREKNSTYFCDGYVYFMCFFHLLRERVATTWFTIQKI